MTTHTQPLLRAAPSSSSSSSAAATQSLQLLLREDKLLTLHELHKSKHADEAAFSYAATLLQSEGGGGVELRAVEALAEVDRKLMLVQSLAERVSRTSPDAVARPLLHLHGYDLDEENKDDENNYNDHDDDSGDEKEPTKPTGSTLLATRDRCHRLHRQSEGLEGVAKRVEGSLLRGLKRMETATSRLERVLQLSSSLKMILRLQFESQKLQGYDLEDLRDLTRAAASVAVMEDLLKQISNKQEPTVVQKMRPEAVATAAAVRRAAAALLKQQQSGVGVVQLGATLQVYFHLGELTDATWSAVDQALAQAKYTSTNTWSTTAIASLMEQANAQARISGKTESAISRNLQTKLRELRADASGQWASGICDAALQVWNLHRVLSRKSDPITRQVFVEVVAMAPVPASYKESALKVSGDNFSIFEIFWDKLCRDLGQLFKDLLNNDKLPQDVAALYPSIRMSAIGMLGSLYDIMQAGAMSVSLEDTSSTMGVLGGSNALDNAFWNQIPEEPLVMASADTWSRSDAQDIHGENQGNKFFTGASTTSSSSIFKSFEWKSLQSIGLKPLQNAFVEACRDRLCTPIQFMFAEGVSVDEDGVAMSILPALPSRYDMQKLEQNIRAELSLADPREGGGDLSMTTMIADVVVDMTERFCARAKTSISDGGDAGFLTHDGRPTENLLHDLKVANVMSALATAIRNAPENTFVVPYRPATSAQHDEAASLCQVALIPALNEIEKTVKTMILSPLIRALNRRVATAIAQLHHGAFLEESLGSRESGSFVQTHLSGLYEQIADQHLSKLPSEYASTVASSVASFSIYTFVSNASLVRPLGETARLHITQDLADFELSLEQLVLKTGTSMTLLQIEQGKPYAELRAVRQMLFWTGLENKSLTATNIAKSMLREVWVKDVRPSTVFHFLFSFAPSLLASPHHSKRTRPEVYVSSLVQLDGSIDDGEVSAWMITMACCDSYQQRESIDSGGDGDKRIAAVLMMIGPELLRRRRQ